MACIRDYFKSGIVNTVDQMLSRINNDYREGYEFGKAESKEVMRKTYAFLTVLKQGLDYYQKHQHFDNKYMLYDTAVEFKQYMNGCFFQQTAEMSKAGMIGIMTPYMVHTLNNLVEFCELVYEN